MRVCIVSVVLLCCYIISCLGATANIRNSEAARIGKLQSRRTLLKTLLSKRAEESCSPEYAALKESVMCAYPDSPDATEMGVSAADKVAIVNEHNKLRRRVATDSKSGSDIQLMYWDDEIAKIAQKWAQACYSAYPHEPNAMRKVPGYGISIGQNKAGGYGTWQLAINGWYDEVKDFTFAGGNDLHKVGHFTQVVKNDASRIGCGFAKCSGTPTYVCDYAYGNAMDLGRPFTGGPACGACGGNCVDSLCDCGGKMCLNGGKLDLSTCSCACEGIYTGDRCENKACPSSEPSYCGKAQPYGFPSTFCGVYTNVDRDCPIMCGTCP